jgi:hypothetical protein
VTRLPPPSSSTLQHGAASTWRHVLCRSA